MQIDVISDTVCPWCFIGKRRLMRAMAMRPNIAFDVKWRPFRLDPTIPKGGTDRQAYMRAKFGDDPMKIVEMYKLITAEGAKDGIEFDFAAIKRRPDTLDSHRLIRWAEAAGVQDEVVERLFIAYFENGEDIGDIRVLADIASLPPKIMAGTPVTPISWAIWSSRSTSAVSASPSSISAISIPSMPLKSAISARTRMSPISSPFSK